MKSILLLFLATFLYTTTVLAAGDGIPVKYVLIQLGNVTCVGILLYFFTRKVVKAHFQERKESFVNLVEKAQKEKNEAEEKKRTIRERLNKLESKVDEDIAKAKSDAELLKQKMLTEAKDLANKIEEEARKTAMTEVEKAKNELREALLNESVQLAQERMKDHIEPEDLKRFRSEFVQKIQVVR